MTNDTRKGADVEVVPATITALRVITEDGRRVRYSRQQIGAPSALRATGRTAWQVARVTGKGTALAAFVTARGIWRGTRWLTSTRNGRLAAVTIATLAAAAALVWALVVAAMWLSSHVAMGAGAVLALAAYPAWRLSRQASARTGRNPR